jgi:hypothetical protein
MKPIVRRVWVVGILVTLCGMGLGCYPSAHLQDLKDRVMQSYTGSLAERMYYIGSDHDYDYYYLWHARQGYRVPQSESNLDHRMDLTNDRSYWEVVNPSAPILGN